MMKPTKKAEDLIYPIQNALDSIQSSLSDEEFNPSKSDRLFKFVYLILPQEEFFLNLQRFSKKRHLIFKSHQYQLQRRFGEIKKSRVRFYNFL